MRSKSDDHNRETCSATTKFYAGITLPSCQERTSLSTQALAMQTLCSDSLSCPGTNDRSVYKCWSLTTKWLRQGLQLLLLYDCTRGHRGVQQAEVQRGVAADLVLIKQVLGCVGHPSSIMLYGKCMLRSLWGNKSRVVSKARPKRVGKILQCSYFVDHQRQSIVM